MTIRATYKFGWVTFTCPSCTDSKQPVPVADPLAASRILAGGTATSEKLIKCTSCDADISLSVEGRSEFAPRPVSGS